MKYNRKFTYDYSKYMEHEKWMQVIPYISFPEDWKVQITPPFNGAVVRFKIKKDSAQVSIYLDCYDYLGSYGSPYWEVYPYFYDVFRCDMYDTEALLKAISLSIETQCWKEDGNKRLDAGIIDYWEQVKKEIEKL